MCIRKGPGRSGDHLPPSESMHDRVPVPVLRKQRRLPQREITPSGRTTDLVTEITKSHPHPSSTHRTVPPVSGPGECRPRTKVTSPKSGWEGHVSRPRWRPGSQGVTVHTTREPTETEDNQSAIDRGTRRPPGSCRSPFGFLTSTSLYPGLGVTEGNRYIDTGTVFMLLVGDEPLVNQHIITSLWWDREQVKQGKFRDPSLCRDGHERLRFGARSLLRRKISGLRVGSSGVQGRLPLTWGVETPIRSLGCGDLDS